MIPSTDERPVIDRVIEQEMTELQQRRAARAAEQETGR